VRIVLRTYKHVFGDMAIWYTRGPDILLLGFREPSPVLDVERLRQRFERADFRTAFGRAEVGSFIQLLAHEIVPLGAVGATDLPGPPHTLRNPILSDHAARAFFVGGQASLPRMPSEPARQAAASGSLLRREIGGEEASEEVMEELTRHACAMARPYECATLLARWTASHPDSPRLAQATRDLRSVDYTGGGAVVLPAATIEALVALYQGRSLTATESPGPVNNALSTSNVYSSFFYHAFPFDRAAVVQAWSKCVADPRTVIPCSAARRKAEQELGPIYSERAMP